MWGTMARMQCGFESLRTQFPPYSILTGRDSAEWFLLASIVRLGGKMNRTGLTLSLIALTVSACAQPIGRPRVLNSTAELVVPKSVDDDSPNNKNRRMGDSRVSGYTTDLSDPRDGLESRLVESWEVISRSGANPSEDELKNFMELSAGAVRFGCHTYFDGKANRQRSLNVARDLFPPLTGFITGLAALGSSDGQVDDDLLTLLTLYSTTATAGFEIYEQRFLFNAKNVDAVRALIRADLIADKKSALEQIGKNPTLSETMVQVLEHQHICWPQNITERVRQAIEEKAIDVIDNTGDSEQSEITDETALGYLEKEGGLSDELLAQVKAALEADGNAAEVAQTEVEEEPRGTLKSTNPLTREP